MESSIITLILVLASVFYIAVQIKKSVRKVFSTGTVPGSSSVDSCMQDESDSDDVENGRSTEKTDYFTYETQPGNTCFTQFSNIEKDNVHPSLLEKEEYVSSNFDLRQAVIHSVILHNGYIESR